MVPKALRTLPFMSSLLFGLACAGPMQSGAHSTAVGGGQNALGADAPLLSLTMGVHQASIGEDDSVGPDGHREHRYEVQLSAGQSVRVRMSSEALDPLLEITGPGDFQARNDDAFAGSLEAMVQFTPSIDGAYQITATSVSRLQTGAYELALNPGPPTGVGPALSEESDLRQDLSQNHQAGLPGSWLHFEGQAGSLVRLRITSTDFDTIATLLGPGGQRWVNDDAGDLGPEGDERSLDSTLVVALPESGTYHLAITAYGGGQGRGAFRVRSEVQPPLMLGENGEVPQGVAGRSHRGRVLGLYVGITAYQNNSQLYGCADDARLLAEAMQVSHLQEEGDQLVLPDSLATRENFLAGIADLAQRAGPDDVVMVFYSGHGQQLPTTAESEHELDGLDEALVLYDGPITDDEVVNALDSINAGTLILALDACNSGGFADDFMTASNRIGLFSSDEDVLSDVAEPHRAGGYLSWHLRRGVLGHGDHRLRDGVLYAGELADYMYQGFVEDHRLMNVEGHLDPTQRLVLRRGGVPWGQVLWVYPRLPDLSLPDVLDTPLQSHPLR